MGLGAVEITSRQAGWWGTGPPPPSGTVVSGLGAGTARRSPRKWRPAEVVPYHSPAKHQPPTPGSSAQPPPQAARQPHPTSAQTSHCLPPAAVGGLTRRPLGESPGAHRWVPEAVPRSWAWVRHSTIPTLQGTGLRCGILGAPLEPQEGGASGCCLPGSLHPEMLRDVDPGSRSQGRSQLSLALCFARDEGGPPIPQPGGPEPVSSGWPTFCSPMWTRRLAHQNLAGRAWEVEGRRGARSAFRQPHSDPLPSPSVFLENRAGAPAALQPAAVHTASQSTRFSSSKSILTSELGPVPAWPPWGHPACPSHTHGPLAGGPWKSPSLSGPRVLGCGSGLRGSSAGSRTGLGGGERGGPGSEPEALSLPNPSWLSLALSGPPWSPWPSLAPPVVQQAQPAQETLQGSGRGRGWKMGFLP